MKLEDNIYNELQEIKKMLNLLLKQTDEYLSLDDASKFLKISNSALYKLTSSNSIKHYKPNGKKILFKKSDLISYIENKCVDTQDCYDNVALKLIEKILK